MGSLPAVWAYILPALDNIMRSQPDSLEPPPLDVNYHMGVYTVVYNFATATKPEPGQMLNGTGMPSSSRSRMLTGGFALGLGGGSFGFDEDSSLSPSSLGPLTQAITAPSQKDWFAERVEHVKSMVGYELYVHLEDYFRGVARDIRSHAPMEDSALLSYYLASYARFTNGVAIINRLFAYLNRHFVTRAVDEGMGWVSMQDVFKDKRPSAKKTKKDAELLEAKKRDQLKHWGFNGGTAEQRRYAETCAEAGSPTDRIIPVASLAHRCWRIEVVEPFLSAGIPKAELTNGNGVALGHPELTPPSPSLPSLVSPLDSLSLDSPPSPPADTARSRSSKKNKKKKEKAKEKQKDKGKQRENTEEDPEIRDEESTSVPSIPTSSIPGSPLPNGRISPITASPSQPPFLSPPIPPPDPRGRLNRVVGELVLTTRGPEVPAAKENAQKLFKSLRTCGLKPDHIVRKRLDKFLHG